MRSQIAGNRLLRSIKQNKNQDIQNQQVGEIMPSKIQGNSKIYKKVYNEIIQMQIDMSQISGITKWRNYFRGNIPADELSALTIYIKPPGIQTYTFNMNFYTLY